MAELYGCQNGFTQTEYPEYYNLEMITFVGLRERFCELEKR